MEKKKSILKELLVILAVLLAVALFAALISSRLQPRRTDYGSTWGQYLKEESNSIDVLFFGSSITYCDVMPAVIWENSGVTSYVMAGSEQTVPISCYYLLESCKTQSPKAVFLEVTGMFFHRYQNYSEINVGYMPAGLNRLQATLFATEPEARTGLLFPPYSYHSRWNSMTWDELRLSGAPYSPDMLAGYTFLDSTAEITASARRGEVLIAEDYALNLSYLKKITDYCGGKGITPVFYIAPTHYFLSEKHRAMLEEDISALEDAVFVDFNSEPDVPEFDPGRDFHDLLHFNCFGAEKFSAYLGDFIKNRLGLEPTANADTALWQQRADYLRSLIPPRSPAAAQ